MNIGHINFYFNLNLLFFRVILMGHNCSLHHHYCKSCQRMTHLRNKSWKPGIIVWGTFTTRKSVTWTGACANEIIPNR